MQAGLIEEKMYSLLGGSKYFKHKFSSDLAIIEIIEKGIPIQAVRTLQSHLRFDDKQMANAISISPKTFASRKLFKTHEANQIVMCSRALTMATIILKNEEKALRWLNTNIPSLSMRKPFDLISSHHGLRLVEHQLGCIEYGIYA